MRAMPGLVVAAPADPEEARAVCRVAVKTPGPWYIRLGKNGEPIIHENGLNNLEVGESIRILDGIDGTIVAAGAITHQAYQAAMKLKENGIRVRLLSMPFLKPIDRIAVLAAASETPWILSVEEHHGSGGLGSIIAEILSEITGSPPLKRINYPEVLDKIGSQDYLRQNYGLDTDSIRITAEKLCRVSS